MATGSLLGSTTAVVLPAPVLVVVALVAGGAATQAVAMAGGAGADVGAVAAVVAAPAMPAAVVPLLAAAKREAAGKPRMGTSVTRTCNACERKGALKGADVSPTSVAMGIPSLSATMACPGGLCAAWLSGMMCWLLVAALLAEGWKGVLAASVISQDRRGLCCLSAWRFTKHARLGSTLAADAAACSASVKCSVLAIEVWSGSALVVAVAVAARAAGTEGAAAEAGAVAAGMAVPKVPAAVAQLLAASKGTAAGTPQKGTVIACSCSTCGLKPGDDGVSSPSAMAAKGLLQAVGLQGLRWSRALLASRCCWLAQRLVVAEVLHLPVPELVALSDLEQLFSLDVVSLLEWTEVATMQLLLAVGSRSASKAMNTPPTAVVAVAVVTREAVAVAGAAAVEAEEAAAAVAKVPAAVVAVVGCLMTAVAAVAVLGSVPELPAAVAQLWAAAKGTAAGTPQKGTGIARNCSACGLKPGDDGVSSPSAMAAEGLLQAVGLSQGVRWSRALLASGCCWMTWRLLVAGVVILPLPWLFSLLALQRLFSLEVECLLEWQFEVAIMQLLLPHSEGLLPVLKTGVPPARGPLIALMECLPAAGEGLAALPAMLSGLRLTAGAPAEWCAEARVLLVPWAVAADADVDLDSVAATAFCRAYASQ